MFIAIARPCDFTPARATYLYMTLLRSLGVLTSPSSINIWLLRSQLLLRLTNSFIKLDRISITFGPLYLPVRANTSTQPCIRFFARSNSDCEKNFSGSTLSMG
jgi:hypothetical protein